MEEESLNAHSDCVSTFLRLNIVDEMSSLHWYSHFGHFFFTCQYLERKG